MSEHHQRKWSEKRRNNLIVLLISLGSIILGLIFFFSFSNASFRYYFTVFFGIGGVGILLQGVYNLLDIIGNSVTGTQKTVAYRNFVSVRDTLNEKIDDFIYHNEMKITIYDENNCYFFNILKEGPKDASCMISKTELDDKEIVLQCPFCLSLYNKKYLLDWLEENNNCPVCKAMLKKEI
ncbi:MAG: hypothetical protein ACTSSH_09695 [Candidatus Heimdallarchaeota archaeon]